MCWYSSGFRGRVGCPRTLTVPLSGLRKPRMTSKSVDFPAPFGPMTPWNVPGSISRLMSSRICRPLIDNETAARLTEGSCVRAKCSSFFEGRWGAEVPQRPGSVRLGQLFVTPSRTTRSRCSKKCKSTSTTRTKTTNRSIQTPSRSSRRSPSPRGCRPRSCRVRPRGLQGCSLDFLLRFLECGCTRISATGRPALQPAADRRRLLRARWDSSERRPVRAEEVLSVDGSGG
ncbi:hypothetical protein EDF53_0802 [Curtobacterium sp. PhB78]|nr:hypothetical protein EDF53_0802 [Curtobacterium sp. PhB78]